MTESNRRFDAVLQQGFDRFCALAPEVATFAGIHAFDDRLPPATADALDDRMRVFADWAKSTDVFSRAELSADRALDADLHQLLLRLFRFQHEEVRPWESNPDALGDLGNLFFVMSFADYPGGDAERFEKMAARLEALPSYLGLTRARVTRPEPRWCRIAAEVAESFPAMLDGLLAGTREKAKALLPRMEKAATAARASAEEHRAWCAARAEGKEFWMLGADRFEHLLDLKGIELDAAELEALGEKYLRELGSERAALVEKIAPGGSFEDAMRVLKSEHPKTFEDAIGTVRRLVAESRAKVAADGICELPEGEELLVLETPEFMRTLTPFAAIFPAAKFSRVQRGLYIVTRPQSAEGLAEAHLYDLRNVVTHEGYPGHHLQLATANRRTSVLRSVDLGGFPAWGGATFAIDVVEGWAHYCEQMMKEHGWCDTDKDRLVLVNDALWRAARIVLDVRLHAGRISFDDAVAFLRSTTGMSKEGATAEVNRYTGSPTYQLSYLTGKHLLLELRAEMKRAGQDERAFHRFVLESGNLPVAWIARSWRSARAA
ncbi:MAG TPA: DUF885 domain-containing protein [bacterium]|nr:DUF885 domain-containing protein [bacterium]